LNKYLKVAFSATLLGFLLYKLDWQNAIRQINGSDLPVISVVFIILVVQFPISACRWGKSLEIHGLNFTYLVLQKTLCISFYINTFLPTSIGGDGYRAMKTMAGIGEKSRAISAILLERILGFLVLSIFGLLGAISIFREHPTPLVKIYILCGVLGGILAMGMKGPLEKYIFGGVHNESYLGKYFDVIRLNYQYIKSNRKTVVQVLLYSIAFQTFAIGSIYLLFKVVGVQTGIANCAFIAGVGGIATVLPISFNGIGVMEGSLALAAAHAGIDSSHALMAALLLRILTIPLTLICGIIYLFDATRSMGHAS
jgi:uncharacterized protein (TIRG00374 family)